MSKPLGTIENKGFDAKGYEQCWQLSAIVECPKCGEEVELWSQTEAWERHGGKWYHSEFDASPSGECCGQTIIYNGLEGKCMVLHS